MTTDHSKYVKKRIEKLLPLGIDYGKPRKLLSFQSGLKEDEFEKELINFKFLKFTEKQDKDGEARYALFFVHNKRKGLVFVITFREKIRIITIYRLGRTTLKRYFKKRFKKKGILK